MAKPKPTKGARAKRTPGQVVLGALKWVGIIAVALAVIGAAALVFVYANTTIPKPNDEFQTNVSTVYFQDGQTPISTFQVHNRVSIPLSEMPENAKQAIVASENEDFWTDPGISVMGLARAVRTAIQPGVDTVGGSTITQQYVKVNYLTQERTITRKLTEIMIALKVSRELSKEEILEGYMNTVYFGRGAYGIQAAARAFFDVDAKDLSDPQAIALMAILNHPMGLDPHNGEAQAKMLLERYQYTINQMVALGYRTPEQKEEIYWQLPDFPKLATHNRLGGPNGFIMNKAKAELMAAGMEESRIDGGGLRIITTVDARLQETAIHAMQNMRDKANAGLNPIGKDGSPLNPNKDPLYFHPAMASLDTATGAIRAMYSSQDAIEDARPWAELPRPTGSTFKPWALVAGLRDGATLNDRFNGNNKMRVVGTDHEVVNAGNANYGGVTLEKATTSSINTAYVDLVQQMEDGPAKVVQAARDVGITSEITEGQAATMTIPLGTIEVSPLEAARGLATLVNEGKRTTPHIVAEVQDMQGNVIYRPVSAYEQTIEPDVAQNAVHALSGVVQDGTARGVRSLGHDVAGKTGTYYDAEARETRATWFIGSTKQISTAVVLTAGEHGTSDLGNTYGSTFPAPAWLEYMQVAMEGQEKIDFPGPTRQTSSGKFSAPPRPKATPAPSKPSAEPSAEPSPEATPEPTPEPTEAPASPRPEPTPQPTPRQTARPEPQPTDAPRNTPAPTRAPTPVPSPPPGEGGG